ncbi:S8 family serine peptidase [Mesorhizobium loti]|nr:S8 family serine peptidase [Mesorhizobium loti]
MPRTILNVTVVLLLAVPFAHAAEPAGELLLEIDGSGLTQKTAEFIGTYGALSAYAPDADSTLKSIVESQCGDAPSEYIWALRVANKKPDLTYESVLEKGELLDLPPCPPRTTGSLVARVVKDGDRIWDYYTEFGKDKLAFGAGAETIAKIDSPFQSTFPTSPRASDPELETALTGIGLQVKSFNELVKTLPLQTPYKIDVMSDSEITYSDVIKAINPRITSLDKIAKDQVIIVPESTKQEYSLPLARAEDGEQLASLGPEGLSAMTGTEISQASRSDGFVFFNAVTSTSCTRLPDVDPQYNNVVQGILEENWQKAGPDNRVHPNIAIVDSGIYDPEELPGSPQIVKPIDPTSSVIYRSRGPSDFEPFPLMKDRMHGTNVAVLALGGAQLAGIAQQIGYKFALHPFKAFLQGKAPVLTADNKVIIKDNQVQYTVYWQPDRDSIMNAIVYSDDHIVNLSFGRDQKFVEMANEESSLSSTLFVVASGNAGSPLDDDPLYPGRNGGLTSPNVLTVASVDGDGKLSSFSNWSSTYVDIAAPGCRVPSLSFSPEIKKFFDEKVSGTSFSAPQVTWTAAAIRSVRPFDKAAALKIRLLAGADVVPALTDKIVEGRVLNIVKALSLWEDVIEVKSADGTRKIFRGKLTDTKSAGTFCSGPDIADGRTILKVVQHFDGRNTVPDQNRIYVEDASGVIRGKNCAAKDFALHVLNSDNTTSEIPGSQVIDVTYSWQ